MPCNIVVGYQHFGGPFWLYLHYTVTLLNTSEMQGPFKLRLKVRFPPPRKHIVCSLQSGSLMEIWCYQGGEDQSRGLLVCVVARYQHFRGPCCLKRWYPPTKLHGVTTQKPSTWSGGEFLTLLYVAT